MMSCRKILGIFLVVGIISASAALAATPAENWIPPRAKVYFADEGRLRLVVNPGLTGAPGGLNRCRAELYETVEGKGRLLWGGDFVNAIGPVDAEVSPSGRWTATFDNWGKIGRGNDVVVLYDAQGKKRFAFGLEKLLGRADVSECVVAAGESRWWRAAPARFDANEERLVVPTRCGTREIDLSTGNISGDTAFTGAEPASSRTRGRLERFLSLFRERESLRRSQDRDSALKRMDLIDKEATRIVTEITGLDPSDDYRLFNEKVGEVLLGAARRYDPPWHEELLAVEEERRIENTRIRLHNIVQTLLVFEMDNARFPTDDEGGLESLTFGYDRPPYLDRKALLDAWGAPFLYSSNIHALRENPFVLRSAGPDGIMGTPDDIEPPAGR